MDIFTQMVVIIGRLDGQSNVRMLGTSFCIDNKGNFITPRHVIGDSDKDLVILLPHIGKINDYQDISNNQCQIVPIKVQEIDPVRDLALLHADLNYIFSPPPIGSLDQVNIGESLSIFGFPHCTEGRRVLTYQKAEVGAKILLEASTVKNKHAVLNIQSRPGQSGSLIFSNKSNSIVGILIGTYAPQHGILVGGVNPSELNQTTHIISAEYILEML